MSRTPSPWLQPTTTAHSLPREVDSEGNVEYKLKLLDPTPERFQHLVTQLKWRLAEGFGEAMYEVGVSDDGSFVGLNKADMNASLETLRKMADVVSADVSIVRDVPIVREPTNHPADLESLVSEEAKRVVEALVRKRLTDDQHFLEIRIAIVGAADAGKSTMLGDLAHGIKDNGRGRSRLNLLRHRHEIESGRTSSISHEIIGYDSSGALINYASTNITTWEHICEQSSKVITFLDTAGHARYLKTTIAGLTGHAPNYACLVVAANAPHLEMTREHLAIAVLLNVPVFVVLTKIDVASADQIRRVIAYLTNLLKTPGNLHAPVVVDSEHVLLSAVTGFETFRQIPIFPVSSVTGTNLVILERFFNLLPKPTAEADSLLEEDVEFQVEEVYNVPKVGCIVAGVLRAGRISVVDTLCPTSLWLGPDPSGTFHPFTVTSIHHHRTPTRHIRAGQAATLAISGSATLRVRKGMVLLGGTTLPRACIEFEAEILVLYHPIFLAPNFQGMIHCGSVRQAARVVAIWTSPTSVPFLPQIGALSVPTIPGPVVTSHVPLSERNLVGELATGKRGVVRFRFVHEPEYLRIGTQVLLREGRTKCIGKVTRVVWDD